jgi:alpha-L-fucosidase
MANVRTSPTFAPVPDRLHWWTDARFGGSFHWGLYSIPARGEWVRSVERLSVAQYQQYFDQFNPVDYNAAEWAQRFKRAGMKYAILTTKHHDGFCLFDSKLTQYKSTNTPCKRDLVKEYVEAFRAAGLRVGLYYSLVDWHHPDYPAWGDRQHPMRDNPSEKDRACNWSNYVNYLHGQITELLTNYGHIDMLVVDFSYNQYTGPKWGAAEIIRKARELQPHIVINDRFSHAEAGNIKSVPTPPWVGDFDTCELNTPHSATTNAAGQILPWELWITHNNSWCYAGTDTAWKSAADIVRTLANCVSKSGNLTLNVGPDARGRIPQQSVEMLEAVGQWMNRNSPSIYGCGLVNVERPDWGRFTLSSDRKTLYAHVTEQPMGHLTLRGLRGQVSRARLLTTGAEAYLGDFWNPGVQSFGHPEDIFLNFYQPFPHTHVLPDPIDTVIAMDWTDPA